MSLEWFEFHPKSFLTDTMRLNTEAKGAYLLLLLDYYEKEGPAPDDDDVLAAITGLSLEAWRRHRKVIQTLFTVDAGLWAHQTCETVIADAKARIARQSAAGKEAARRRWNKDAKRNADRNANRIPNAVPPASETDTDRNATAEADFGPSVTAPSHKGGGNGIEVPNNADRMPIVSEAQCETDAERNAIAMHTSQFTGRREGANAPSPANALSIGSLLDPEFTPESFMIASAIRDDGVSPEELSGWLDDWKGRCLNDGTRLTNWHAAWDREYDRRVKLRAKARPKPRVSVSKKRLEQLPDGWAPGPTHHKIAGERNLNIAACIESFSDYIVNKRPDWKDADAAFRQWLKSPHRTEFLNGQAQTTQRRAPSPRGSIVDAVAELDAEFARRGAGGAVAEDQPHGGAAVLSLSED